MKNKNTGQYNILKIISVFMILILHYMNNDMGGNGLTNDLNIYGFTTHMLESVSIVACNIFVLITAWFMFDRNEIKFKKIFDILNIVIFYAIFFFIGYVIVTKSFNASILKIFFETIFKKWFPIIYIILYLLIPYINPFIKSLSKENYKKLIIIMIIFFSIWPTFLTGTTVRDEGYGIINFILLYLIIGYIKRFINLDKIESSKIILLYLLSLIAIFIFGFISLRAWMYNSIFVIINSIALFLIFTKINIKNNFIVKYISGFSLSTYIIHENKFICKWLYRDVFKSSLYSKTIYLIPNIFLSIICIFIFCILLEIIRRFLSKYTCDKIFQHFKYYNYVWKF